jgi:hypothetical protein
VGRDEAAEEGDEEKEQGKGRAGYEEGTAV